MKELSYNDNQLNIEESGVHDSHDCSLDPPADSPVEPHAATLKDVAALAGVTHTTVSRAINHPEKLKEDTLQRIYAAMEALQYRPNLFARGMRTSNSGTVAILVPSIVDSSCAALVQGAQDTLSELGYQLIIASSDHNGDRERTLCRKLNDQWIDGMIIANSVNEPAPTDLFPENANLVLIARYVSDRPFDGLYLDIDDGVEQIVTHLRELGHERIALITGPESNPESRQRIYALRQALSKYELSLPESYIRSASWTASGGWTAMQDLLRLPEPPTAVLAMNDTLAMGAAGGAADLGIVIPRDLSLVGFYNEAGSESFYPPLTTVDTGYYEIGCRAAQLLYEQIRGNKREYVSLLNPVQLVVRRSTGPVSPHKH